MEIYEGLDVTDILGIKKHDPQSQDEQSLSEGKQPKSKVLKFFMQFAPVRYVYFKLNHVEKGWPNWIAHTDEERIQTCAKILMSNYDKAWFITEKLDGQSATFFTHRVRKWGIPRLQFGVCSRNIWLKKADNSNYWKVAQKFDLENKLKSLKKEIVVQGEILNTNVQGNKYKVTEPDFYVFNVIQNGMRYPLPLMVLFCKMMGLKHVPILYDSFMPSMAFPDAKDVKDVVQSMVKMSIAKSTLIDIQREGIVCRLIDNPSVSLKVINPEFLLKYSE